MEIVTDYRMAIVEAMVKLAKVHNKGYSFSFQRAWSVGDDIWATEDYKRWMEGIRDHRICDYVAVTAQKFWEMVISVRDLG